MNLIQRKLADKGFLRDKFKEVVNLTLKGPAFLITLC